MHHFYDAKIPDCSNQGQIGSGPQEALTVVCTMVRSHGSRRMIIPLAEEDWKGWKACEMDLEVLNGKSPRVVPVYRPFGFD